MYNSKETIKEYNKNYYAKTRDDRLKKMSEKVECITCNCFVTRGKYNKHLKTKKHLNSSKILEKSNVEKELEDLKNEIMKLKESYANKKENIEEEYEEEKEYEERLNKEGENYFKPYKFKKINKSRF